MEITMSDYPFGYLQDVKWEMFSKGFEMVKAEQIDKRKIRMLFDKKKKAQYIKRK